MPCRRFDSAGRLANDRATRDLSRARRVLGVTGKTMSWEEFGETEEQDEEPAMTLGDLRSGETVTITVREEPETFTSDYADHDETDDALRVPCEFHESDYAFETMDGDAFEDGDRVTLITWSRRLGAAFRRYAQDNGGVVGETVVVEKSGANMETNYSVSEA